MNRGVKADLVMAGIFGAWLGTIQRDEQGDFRNRLEIDAWTISIASDLSQKVPA